MQFRSCHTPDKPLGIYPLVDRADKLKCLFDAGITTAQIRIKDLDGQQLEQELVQADTVAKSYQARLFINDYWKMALQLNSYGVHLGQEDVLDADLSAIHQAGIRLGVSTHTPAEIDSALTIQPSYLAIGPIFETQSKQLSYPTIGLKNLQHWVETLDVPVVTLQLVELFVEPLTIKKVGGIYRNAARGDLIRSVVGSAGREVKVRGRNALDLIDVVEPDNGSLSKQVIIPSDTEIAENPRARSAKLRLLENVSS